jgi:hypothetical protein
MADYGNDNFGRSSKDSSGNFEPSRPDRQYPERGPVIENDRGTERLGDPLKPAAGTATAAFSGTASGASTGYEARSRSARDADTGTSPAPRRDGFARPQSIPALLKDLTAGMGSLVRNEIALAKAEMREKASMLARNAVYVVIGGVAALAGTMVLLGAFVGALSSIFDAAGVSARVYSWLSPLIVSLVVLGVAGLLIKKGLDRIKCASLTPERTAQSLRETGEWVKEKVS